MTGTGHAINGIRDRACRRLWRRSGIARTLRWAMIALAALPAASAYAADAELVRFAVPTPPSHIWTQEGRTLARELEEASGGRFRVAFYSAGELGTESMLLSLVQTGALDLAFITVAEISTRLPAFGSLFAPYLAPAIADVPKVLASDPAQDLLARLPDTLGVVGLDYGNAGMRQIITRRKVAAVGDLKGKKIRIPPLMPLQGFYNTIGAAPTAMDISSVYEAFANGQVDALDFDLELIWKLQLYRLAETQIVSNHMMFPMVAMASAPAWEAFTPAERRMVRGLVRERLAAIQARYIAAEARYKEQLTQAGIEIRTVGPAFFKEALRAWEREWRPRLPTIAELRRTSGRIGASQEWLR